MRSAHFVWDSYSVPLVFLPALRPIYNFPSYCYMVPFEKSLYLLYDVIPHYYNSDHFRIPSDHFRLYPSTFRLFPNINLWILPVEGPPYYLRLQVEMLWPPSFFGTIAVTTIMILELERARKDFFSWSLLSKLHFLVSFYWFVRFSYYTNIPHIMFQVLAPDLQHI